MEAEIGRLQSDRESEKGTRARTNALIHQRLDAIDQQQRKLERIIWMGMGALAALQFILRLQ